MPVIGTPISGPSGSSINFSGNYSVANLRAIVSEYLGFGADYSLVGSGEKVVVDRCVEAGLAQFYYPPTPPAPMGFSWPFLKPVIHIPVLGKFSALPSAFGGIEGPVTLDSTYGKSDLQQVHEGQIRKWHNEEPRTGPPRACAVVAAQSDGSSRQGWSLMVYPTPDKVYSVSAKAWMNPVSLTDSEPYPFGSGHHGELCVAACISAAELHVNDERGPRHTYYLERLSASLNLASQVSRSRVVGPIIDESDSIYPGMRHEIHHQYGGAIINGEYIGNTDIDYNKSEKSLYYIYGGVDGVVRSGDQSGLSVIATTTPTLLVTVKRGMGMISERVIDLLDDTPLAITPPTTNPQIQLIQYTLGTGLNIKYGTEALTPVAPSLDAASIGLAQIYCRTAMTSVKDANDNVNGYITDVRSFL